MEIYWNKKRCIHALKYVTQHYSIFDFLLGLGTYFTGIRDVHQYTLKDVYEIVYQYAHFPDDNILHELIAIDYYRQYKIKPQQLFIQEISSEEKKQIIRHLSLDSDKYRFIMLPISFDFTTYAREGKFIKTASTIIFQYNAVTLPETITLHNLQLEKSI